MKKINIFVEPQNNGYCCLSPCMKTIGTYLNGRIISQKRMFQIGREAESQLRSYLPRFQYKQASEGLGSTGVIAMARCLDLEAFLKRKAQFEHIKFFIDRELPVLLNSMLWSDKQNRFEGHYSIAIGYDGGEIIIADPNDSDRPEYTLQFKKFSERWYDPHPSNRGWMAAFWRPKDRVNPPFRGKYINSI
jgi:hypothetical protein